MSGKEEIERLIIKVMEESHLSYPIATYLVWMEIWSGRMRRKIIDK